MKFRTYSVMARSKISPNPRGRSSIAARFWQGAPKTPGYLPPMELGRLAAIWRYPVKSLRGERLTHARVADAGILGDRSSALFVRGGHARDGKTYRGKEHDRLHLTGDPEAARQLGARQGVELEHRRGEHFFDAAPISVVIDRWMTTLNAHLGYAVEPERFRPEFLRPGGCGFDAGESALGGATLRLGEVTLRVRCPIERCVTMTYDPAAVRATPKSCEFSPKPAQLHGNLLRRRRRRHRAHG